MDRRANKNNRLYKNLFLVLLGATLALLIFNVIIPQIKQNSVSFEDKAVALVKKHVFTEDNSEPVVFEMKDVEELAADRSLFEDVADDDLLIAFTDRAVVYSRKEDKIIFVVNLKL